ncbi:MAG: hypothetical protein ACLUNZ_08370 [Evtepia sp.]
MEEWTAYLAAAVLDSRLSGAGNAPAAMDSGRHSLKPETRLRIRKNIQKLYAAYHSLPDFREITIDWR